MAERVNQLGEFGLIERESARLSQSLPQGWVGIGDDCAVIPLAGLAALGLSATVSSSLVATTDMLVEHRHFRRDYASFFDIGWKTLAVSLSDIAAMGARPVAALITLQLPQNLSVSDLDEWYSGFGQLSNQYDVRIVGGDTVQGTELAFGASVLGVCESSPLLRKNAKPGDDVWLSGSIGGAGLGLALKQGKLSLPLDSTGAEKFTKRYNRPCPRLELGQELSKGKLAHAAIDVSDGLLQDAKHIAAASGVILEIEAGRIPLDPEFLQLEVDVFQAASFGDDYELLFTAGADKRSDLEALGMNDSIQNLGGISRIGTVRAPVGVEQPELMVKGLDGKIHSLTGLIQSGCAAGGYQHFR